jgi:uncharacterized protein with GYD domain
MKYHAALTEENCNLKGRGMSRYLMLAKFNTTGNTNIKAVTERVALLTEIHERFGASVMEFFGSVGDYDVIVLFEAPNLKAVKKIDMAGKLHGMVETTKILPLFGVEALRSMITEL